MPINPMIANTIMMIACPRSPFLYLGRFEIMGIMGMGVEE
jgi:hypothetical protein